MRRVMLGDVIFDVVETENAQDQAEITTYAVEDGSTFSDHHAVLPSVINITGIFGNKGSDKKLATLQRYLRESTLLTYTGRNLYQNMVIVNIDRNHTGENKYGFEYDIELQHVPIQSSKRVNVQVANPTTKKKDNKVTQKVSAKGNKGRKQTRSGGSNTVRKKGITSVKTYAPQKYVRDFDNRRDDTLSQI